MKYSGCQETECLELSETQTHSQDCDELTMVTRTKKNHTHTHIRTRGLGESTTMKLGCRQDWGYTQTDTHTRRDDTKIIKHGTIIRTHAHATARLDRDDGRRKTHKQMNAGLTLAYGGGCCGKFATSSLTLWVVVWCDVAAPQ